MVYRCFLLFDDDVCYPYLEYLYYYSFFCFDFYILMFYVS